MLSPIYKVNLIQQGPWMMHPSSGLLWDDGLGTSALHCGSWGRWLPQHRTHSMQGTSPLDPAASLLDTMLPIYHTTSFPICSCSICIPPSLPALVRKAFVSAINHETRERTNAKLLKAKFPKWHSGQIQALFVEKVILKNTVCPSSVPCGSQPSYRKRWTSI